MNLFQSIFSVNHRGQVFQLIHISLNIKTSLSYCLCSLRNFDLPHCLKCCALSLLLGYDDMLLCFWLIVYFLQPLSLFRDYYYGFILFVFFYIWILEFWYKWFNFSVFMLLSDSRRFLFDYRLYLCSYWRLRYNCLGCNRRFSLSWQSFLNLYSRLLVCDFRLR